MPWDIHIDPESGVEYYYNTASGETCWELPEDDPLNDLHQLVFMVHGIGQHDDFVDGQFTSWDGTDGLVGGNHEFRELLEALLGGRLREVPLWLTVMSVEWHAQLHRPELDALLSACAPEGVNDLRTFGYRPLWPRK